MPKRVQKWMNNVEQIETCDFSIFAKCITLELIFGTIKGASIEHNTNKKLNEFIDWRKGLQIVRKGM